MNRAFVSILYVIGLIGLTLLLYTAEPYITNIVNAQITTSESVKEVVVEETKTPIPMVEPAFIILLYCETPVAITGHNEFGQTFWITLSKRNVVPKELVLEVSRVIQLLKKPIAVFDMADEAEVKCFKV